MNQEVLEIVLKILETKKVQELIEKLVNLFLHRKIKSHDLLAFYLCINGCFSYSLSNFSLLKWV